jgi:hypothetical protein
MPALKEAAVRRTLLMLLGVAALSAAGCKTHHTVHIDPIEVKPLTVNVNIRVQKELDEFFDFEQPVAQNATTPPAGNTGVTQ